MCGRFTQVIDDRTELATAFGFPVQTDSLGEIRARWNGAPSQEFCVVCATTNGAEAAKLRWGLAPAWSRSLLINARVETVDQKPSFRSAFRRRRCLIPANGWFEWSRAGEERLPWWIPLPPESCFAGLWESGEGPDIGRFAVLTCPATDALRKIHSRQPVLLHGSARASWLDAGVNPARLAQDAAVPHSGPFAARRVGTAANNVRNDRPEILEPLQPE